MIALRRGLLRGIAPRGLIDRKGRSVVMRPPEERAVGILKVSAIAPPSGTPNGVQEGNVVRHGEGAKQLISPAAKSTSSKTVENLFDKSEDRSLPQSQRTPSELAQRLTKPKSKFNLRSAKKLLRRSRWRGRILKGLRSRIRTSGCGQTNT
ncbi:hypothetical protein NDU88_002260 [Pleurodeles waltl]|uniref:Uncharacterized protein n=1 Tax=Pleurodeles waltl TaxID=8319 RepID=A0AAV7UCN2_PLEWA|nr:hypothetical protein NDU88_002260 [Pleurodeles waltl]